MPKLVLLLLVVLCACGEPPQVQTAFIDGVETAPLLECTALDGANMPGSPIELSAIGDTAIAALFDDARTLLLLDSRLRVLRRVDFARAGPNAALAPASVAIHADSLFIADAKGERIIVFDWLGRAARTIRTDFAPVQIVRRADGFAVVPAVVGRFPGTLLFELRAGGVIRRDVAVVDFPDLTTKALGNRVKLLAVGDRLLLLHQFFTPRALLIGEHGQNLLRVPLPAGARKAVGYVPPLPLNDEALRPALVVANDAAVTEKKEILMLVRSGRQRGDGFEKAIMRADSALNFVAAYRLPVGAGLLGYVAREHAVVVVDDDDQWHRCTLPS